MMLSMSKFHRRPVIRCMPFLWEGSFFISQRSLALWTQFFFSALQIRFAQAMAITLSKGVIIAICASVGGIVLAAGSFLVIKLLRLKYKSFSALTRETSERRLSRYSGGNFSFTDADFARTPGTRTKLRRSINNPYSNPRNDWASIPSCDDLPRRVVLPRSHKALVVDQAMSNPNLEGRRWPIPPRLKRTNAIPLSVIKTSPSIRLVERSPKYFDTSPTKSYTEDPVRIKAEKRIEHDTESQMAGSPVISPVDVSSEATTKPKPLFYGKQRSISTSVISPGVEGSNKFAPTDLSRTAQGQLLPPLMRQSSLPRSSSLFTQQPGKAPGIPMPKLPSEISAQIQRIKSATDTGNRKPSDTNFASEDTSLVDGGASRAFSHTDTNFTSISLKSPAVSDFASVGLEIDLENEMLEKTSNFLRKEDLCTQMGSQQSLATSIQQRLPRDNSSGLRFSMYDHSQPHNESSTTPNKDMSLKSVVKAPGSADRRYLGQQALSSGLAPDRSKDTKDHEKAQESQISTSILKDVSGNEGSPLRWGSRPSSIVAIDSFRYNPGPSMRDEKSSATPLGSRHNRRQSCARSSNLPTVIPAEQISPNMNEGLEVASADPLIPGLFGNVSVPHKATSHPQSNAIFSPRIHNTKQSQSLTVKPENSNSPAVSAIGLYKHNDSSSESISSTPTRRPSGRNPSTIQPSSNRRRIFPSSNPYDPETAPNLPVFSDVTIPRVSADNAETSSASFQHSSLRFPDSLKPTESSPWCKPPLHGPRAPPCRFRFSARRSPTRQLSVRRSLSRSPTRFAVGKHQSLSSPSPGSKQLLNSIMDLRRMNSDVSKSGNEKAHRRFHSLGSAEHTVDEGEAGSEQWGRTGSKEKLTEGMRTPRHVPELEIPGLLFSDRKNEDGVWEAPKWAIGHGDDGLYGEDGFLKD